MLTKSHIKIQKWKKAVDSVSPEDGDWCLQLLWHAVLVVRLAVLTRCNSPSISHRRPLWSWLRERAYGMCFIVRDFNGALSIRLKLVMRLGFLPEWRLFPYHGLYALLGFPSDGKHSEVLLFKSLQDLALTGLGTLSISTCPKIPLAFLQLYDTKDVTSLGRNPTFPILQSTNVMVS